MAEQEIQDRWLWYIDEELVAKLFDNSEQDGTKAKPEPPRAAGPPLIEALFEPAPEVIVNLAALEPEQPGTPIPEVASAPTTQPEPEIPHEAESPVIPEAPRATLWELADEQFVQRHYEEALSLYHQALESNPAEYGIHYNLGVCLLNLGRFPEAHAEFESVLKSDPDSADARVGLGWALLQMKQPEQALALFDPADKRWLPVRSQALSMLSRYAEAPAALEQQIETDPDNAELHFQLGFNLFQTKHWTRAIDAFMNCLARQRNRVEAWIYLGLAQWSAGRTEAAANSFEKALQRDPDCVPALRCRVTLALATGDADAATEYEAHLADLGQTLPEFCYNLGVLQQSANRLDEAAQSYRRAVAKRPTYGAALVNLGCLLMESGNPEQATNVWMTALSVDPAVLAQ